MIPSPGKKSSNRFIPSKPPHKLFLELVNYWSNRCRLLTANNFRSLSVSLYFQVRNIDSAHTRNDLAQSTKTTEALKLTAHN